MKARIRELQDFDGSVRQEAIAEKLIKACEEEIEKLEKDDLDDNDSDDDKDK